MITQVWKPPILQYLSLDLSLSLSQHIRCKRKPITVTEEKGLEYTHSQYPQSKFGVHPHHLALLEQA
jgi:hypothetical protein